VGGRLGSAHAVKGLDWDLLKRVRAGEDVSVEEREEVARGEAETEGKEGVDTMPGAEGEPEEVDVDEEFDKVLEGKEDEALPSAPREKEKKKGHMAPPPPRRTRDEILRELKASRAAAAAAAANVSEPEPALGARFKKIGDSRVEKKRLIEVDESGRRREVLVITDSDGKTKRKTRWLDKPGTAGPHPAGCPVPNKEAKPLGMEVPAEIAAKASQDAEEDDDDIFEGVGADYDPLGTAGSDEDSSESDEDGEVAPNRAQHAHTGEATGQATQPRNYFATTIAGNEAAVESERANPITNDPVLLAALKRAAALRQASSGQAAEAEGDEAVDQTTLLRRKKFLEEAQRQEALDAMDLDYGFGGSRLEDDEDDEAVVLEGRGGTKRKRGPKKKKGDKDSASDVMRVLDGRAKS
jgi:hypothetical protein